MCDHTFSNDTAEHWAVFPEDPRYSVSDLGNVKNNKTGYITKGRIQYSKKRPYYRFKLGKHGKTIGVHYMVLVSFVPKPEGKWFCDHINRDSLDNRLSNLRWLSNSSNTLNSDRCTHYRFNSKGEFDGAFIGLDEAAKSVGVSTSYLRNRMYHNKQHIERYASPFVRGYYFISKKMFHQSFYYLW